MTYTVHLTLAVESDSIDAARDLGISAGEHLLETFNDDSSIGSAIEVRAEPLALGNLQAHTRPPEADEIIIEHLMRVTDQTCYDMMCTAIEGGINYWADVGKRTRALREGQTIPDYTSFEADVQDGPVSCDHPDIEAAEVGRFTIDPGMIRDGIRRLLAPGAQISPAIRNDVLLLASDPEHGPDADSADAIVQFAVFGELVFG